MGAVTVAVAGRADVNVPKEAGAFTSQGVLGPAQAMAVQRGFHACEKQNQSPHF